jgi:hypothetical protein
MCICTKIALWLSLRVPFLLSTLHVYCWLPSKKNEGAPIKFACCILLGMPIVFFALSQKKLKLKPIIKKCE